MMQPGRLRSLLLPLAVSSGAFGCAVADIGYSDEGTGGASRGTGGALPTGGVDGGGGSGSGGLVGTGSTSSGGAASGGAASGGAASGGAASGGAASGGAASGGAASGGAASGGAASGGSGSGGGATMPCMDAPLWQSGGPYLGGDQVTSQCGPSESVAGCIGGQTQVFECKAAAGQEHFCNDYEPGVTDGWWGGWLSAAQCP